jgi:hypothetical protein
MYDLAFFRETTETQLEISYEPSEWFGESTHRGQLLQPPV